MGYSKNKISGNKTVNMLSSICKTLPINYYMLSQVAKPYRQISAHFRGLRNPADKFLHTSANCGTLPTHGSTFPQAAEYPEISS
ncbi:MAG: hypothetical protein LBQ22_02520 [Bacteroidales bacterium]|jgi:hypothetical protein|nr:hypothetical protein [Bacteroidales bacterium]